MVKVEVLISLIIHFIIGLICGLLVKTALKLAVGVVALAILLSWAGYEGVPTIQDLFNRVKKNLPTIIETGKGWLDSLPYTAPMFIVGFLIGVWWK